VEGLRRRGAAAGGAGAEGNGAASAPAAPAMDPSVTPEQRQLVAQILKAKVGAIVVLCTSIYGSHRLERWPGCGAGCATQLECSCQMLSSCPWHCQLSRCMLLLPHFH
jgi:hypothetical protein